jgi:hypothetical protein
MFPNAIPSVPPQRSAEEDKPVFWDFFAFGGGNKGG